MSFKTTGEKFFEFLKTSEGLRFLGSVKRASREDQFTFPPSSSLRVKKGSPVDPGMVIFDQDGIAFGVVHRYISSYYDVYRLVQFLQKGTLYRESTSEDSVTGLENSSGPTSLGEIYFSLEPTGVESGEANISAQEFQLFAVANLKLNDRVDNMKVTRVVSQGGIVSARVMQQ